MAKPKGHKDGCRCVACSPATRKRGQAALAKLRKNPSTPKKRQTSAAAGTRKRKASARTNPGPAGGVVQQPAPTPAKRTRRKTTRRNPATATATAAPAARSAPCRCPHLPSPLSAGEFVVLQAGVGGKLSPIKAFRTQTDAENFLKTATGPRAVVARVMSTWGGT